jgi:hypothetical protein
MPVLLWQVGIEAMQRGSGVSASLMAGLVSGAYGYHLGFWPGPEHPARRHCV